MTIGLCTVISVKDMQVITYALESFDLACDQAKELFKGVVTDRVYAGEISDNNLRRIILKLPEFMELVVIQEIEIGKKVCQVK